MYHDHTRTASEINHYAALPPRYMSGRQINHYFTSILKNITHNFLLKFFCNSQNVSIFNTYLHIKQAVLMNCIGRPLSFQFEHHHPTVMTSCKHVHRGMCRDDPEPIRLPTMRENGRPMEYTNRVESCLSQTKDSPSTVNMKHHISSYVQPFEHRIIPF